MLILLYALARARSSTHYVRFSSVHYVSNFLAIYVNYTVIEMKRDGAYLGLDGLVQAAKIVRISSPQQIRAANDNGHDNAAEYKVISKNVELVSDIKAWVVVAITTARAHLRKKLQHTLFIRID